MPTNTVQDRALLAGLKKRGGGQNPIQWLDATVPVGTPGQFTEVNLVGATVTIGPTNRINITFSGGGGSGTVTSVGLALPASVFNVTGSPVTTSGTLTGAFVNQNANLVFAGPATGAPSVPTFRALVAADLPAQSTQKAPGCIFSNGNILLSGTLTDEIYIPYSGTITGWVIFGDASGSASIVVSNATYANYNTMTTLLTATCTSAIKNQATGLSIAVVAGALRFSGSGFSGFTRCSIVLTVQT